MVSKLLCYLARISQCLLRLLFIAATRQLRLRRPERAAAPARRAGRPFPHGLPAPTGGPQDHHHPYLAANLPGYGVATKSHPCALVAFVAVQATQPLHPAGRALASAVRVVSKG